MSAPALVTLRLASGEVVGPVSVQGSGGAVPSSSRRERLELEIERANEGRPLGLYEPRPGHVSVYLRKAAGDEGRRDVDLRGAEVLSWL